MCTINKTILNVILFILSLDGISQVSTFNAVDLHPVSPTAFQFLKYSEIPVSEYTGIPNVNVPLYEVSVDNVKIPIQLNYHSQGFRVSQEASWVGLGWDCSVGSIVQQINDRDDYGYDPVYTNQPNIKLIPDYFPANGDGSPFQLPMRYLLPSMSRGNGWYSPYPVNTVQKKQGYAVATDFAIPVNGNFDIRQYDLFNTKWYDSEPDIFTANFLGETVKFILNFSSNISPAPIIVLNKAGYKVYKTANGFQIINPAGNTFFFEKESVIQGISSAESFQNGGVSSGSSFYEPVSKMYFLTKIVTINKKEINFQYSNTSSLYESYPSYGDKLDILTNRNINSAQLPPGSGTYLEFNQNSYPNPFGIYRNYAQNKESYTYLSEIDWDNGKLTFNSSDRLDIVGAKKLDQISLYDYNSALIKSWNLIYDYFNSQNISGGEYQYANGTNLSNESRSSLRLKLSSLIDDNGGVYSFNYNSTLLPKKNSFAQDYWGFYNGQLGNTSLALNPAIFGHSDWAVINNNREANLDNAKASILQKITYPTGGAVSFDYELNAFSKDQMIDYPTSNSTIMGNGLRIKSITSEDGITNKKQIVNYLYAGGKLITPMRLLRQIPYSSLDNISSNTVYSSWWTLNELSSNGIFSSNPLASIGGVGYDMVTKQIVNINGENIGRTETYFSNVVDTYNPTIYDRELSYNIPIVKSSTAPDNGSVLHIKIFDNNGNIKKEVENNYHIVVSDVGYGARVFNKSNLLYVYNNQGSNETNWITRNLVGYYPIFDTRTLLDKSVETVYDNSNLSALTKTFFSYDGFDQIAMKEDVISDKESYATTFNYPYSNYPNNSSAEQALYAANRINEVVKIDKYKYGFYPVHYPYTYLESDRKEFEVNGDKILLKKIITNNHPGAIENPGVHSYDQYDLANSNILQYTDKAGIIHSFLWGYKRLYPIVEVIGTDYSTVNSIVSQAQIDAATNGVSDDNYVRSLLNNIRNGLSNTKALVTTYTYKPLIGITSQTDPSGHTIYYEYDAFNRLKLIRDKDNNIVKKFDYQYSQNSSNITVFYNDAQTVTLSRNNCGTGYIGNSMVYNIPANTYSSLASVADANTKALAAAQAYVNANGTCTSNCTTATCYGEGYKCVNGVCEFGVQVFTNSTYDNLSGWYQCTYHYEWSDGTWSSDITVNRESPCF